MGYTIRVSLPGYNALTDTNPDHYALYSDEDWILIKEKARGALSATSSGNGVSHGLGYIPSIMVFYKDGSSWNMTSGDLYDDRPLALVDGAALYVFGTSSGTTEFKYYIFYDQQV